MAQIVLTGSVGLGGENRDEDVRAVKTCLVQLGFDWLDLLDGAVGPLTVATIKLFQAIKNGYDTVEAHPQNDGLVEVGGATHRWLEALNAPHWQRLPPGGAGQGFTKLFDGDDHDFGTRWLAETLIEAGAQYHAQHLAAHPKAALLTVNDASLPRGGDTPSHAGHETGLVMDLRLPCKNGSVGGITHQSPTYDQAAARAMIQAFRTQPLFERAFFNDPALIEEKLCAPLAGHDNHIHVEISPPIRIDP